MFSRKIFINLVIIAHSEKKIGGKSMKINIMVYYGI